MRAGTRRAIGKVGLTTRRILKIEQFIIIIKVKIRKLNSDKFIF